MLALKKKREKNGLLIWLKLTFFSPVSRSKYARIIHKDKLPLSPNHPTYLLLNNTPVSKIFYLESRGYFCTTCYFICYYNLTPISIKSLFSFDRFWCFEYNSEDDPTQKYFPRQCHWKRDVPWVHSYHFWNLRA